MQEPLLNTDKLRAAHGPGSKWAREAGERVQARRAELKVSQQWVAGAANTTLQTIFRVERGELVPRDYLRGAIAFALMTEVDDLWRPSTRDEMFDLAAPEAAA